jgi:hypothetical protein
VTPSRGLVIFNDHVVGHNRTGVGRSTTSHMLLVDIAAFIQSSSGITNCTVSDSTLLDDLSGYLPILTKFVDLIMHVKESPETVLC